MNRHILLVALILSISIFGNVLAKKVSQKDQNTVIHNQPIDDEREEELILLPEILDRLEGGSGDDDSDLGPELPPSSYTSDSDSKDNSNGEPNLLSIEDDSDEDDNIFKPSNPIDHSNETPVYNETPENQEKNLLNIDHGEVEVGEDSDDTDTTNSVPNGGDIETEEEDFGNSPTSDNEGGIGFTTVETESVVIDGQYHMFDVAPCTVIKIPIGKRRVRVDAENIFNSNMTLLTDAQLTNCSELANFECPQDATFCRKGALASNNVAEIELEQEACGVEDAYLYVLPLDAAIALSYKVRVEDIGQPLCDDNSEAKTDEDTEEVQEPELIPTESDDSDDSDNSDDRDDTDIAEDINDDQIFEGDARVDGKLHSYDLDACTVLTIPIKKRPVKIVVDDIFNSGKVMVTDVKLATCTELIEFRCPSNNTFCQIEDLDDFEGLEDGIQLTSQACNTDTAYLYVLPETDGGLVSFEARIKKLKNYSCSTQEDSSPLPVVIIDTTPTDNSTSADNTTDATTPAPSTQESTDSQSDVPAIGDNEDNQVDSTTNTSQGIADTGSNSNGGTIVLIIFGSSFAIFLAVVCIYRRQFKKNRVEMFSPPAWCPNCLFPRMPVRMMSNPTGYGQIDYNEYEPPVL